MIGLEGVLCARALWRGVRRAPGTGRSVGVFLGERFIAFTILITSIKKKVGNYIYVPYV